MFYTNVDVRRVVVAAGAELCVCVCEWIFSACCLRVELYVVDIATTAFRICTHDARRVHGRTHLMGLTRHRAQTLLAVAATLCSQ